MAGRPAPAQLAAPARWATALLVMAALLSSCGTDSTSSGGIGHPAGPSLAEFGLTERCRAGSSCIDRAFAALEELLMRLGPAVAAPAMDHPNAPPPPDRLVVTFDRDPMLDWRAASGAAGSSSRIAIDLTDDAPYALVAPGQAFRVDPADARRVLEALFIPAP